MSRSKRTRTKFTDHPPPRHVRRLNQARMEVAAEAARIIATEGQHNYHAAKKKAAERIGVSERLALPSNVEVQDALQSYLFLYGGTDHLENLRDMRQAAVHIMRLLEAYKPRLVGAVLDGTAVTHSRISFHVFAESIESVLLFFIERGIEFNQEQRQIRWPDGGHRFLPLIVSEFEGHAVELAVFEPVHLRQAPPSPIDGKPQRRATLPEVNALLSDQFAESAGAKLPPTG